MPQFLVRFENRTHVIDISVPNLHNVILQDKLRQTIADKTGWPAKRLTWESFDTIQQGGTLRTISCLRGGKGGFGSLLKGQSKQAGAKATTNFGACRDLQGRRLRHVNQAIEQRVWQEWKAKVEAGSATEAEMAKALLNTDSGVAGWYLQLPAWAEVSFSQEQRKWRRQFHQWKKEQEAKAVAANERRRVQEAQVQSYLQAAQDASSQVQSNLKSALKEGLQAKRQKVEPDPPTALLTLAGDDVTLAFHADHNAWQMQSPSSNFCTVGIILRHDVKEAALYYEIMVETGGLVQVGWASTAFRPSSEAGDGVGDCSHSWAYDGSRQIKLHGESSESYYGESWKAGDIVGCLYNIKSGEISYSLNGKDMGVAFKVTHERQGESDESKSIFPAISCNPSEIVELRLIGGDLEHQPAGSVPVGDVLATEDVSLPAEDESEAETETKAKEITTKDDAKEPDVKSKTSSEQKSEKTALVVQPLDLEKYNSVEELEALGLDRLKGALMAIEVKCGGTLHERASRLFSLKGLKPEEYPPKLRVKRKT